MKRLFFIFFLIPIFCFSQSELFLFTKHKQGVRKEPLLVSDFFDTIKKYKKLRLLNFNDRFVKVKYSDTIGYVPISSVYKKQEVRDYLESRNIESLKRKYPDKIAERISNNQIWIGMSVNMLIDSVGFPNDKNTYKSERTKTEQWIYENNYIYISDGKITNIQSF